MNTPKWFKVVAVIALLWNLLGCLAFAMDLRMTPEDVAALPEAQQALYAARPGWAVVATAVAVIGGSVPFVLFFEGLARAEATQAAFIQ